MSGSTLALLEMVLLLAAVGGWAGWQLWSLRQAARLRARRQAQRTDATSDAD